MFLHQVYIESDLKSARNKHWAEKEEDLFYETLKEFVIKSNSFYEFCCLVKDKYKFYQ